MLIKPIIKIYTLYIRSTGKNTFISIFDNNYKLLKINSCGLFGFKSRKKESSFACSVVANKSALFVLKKDVTNINIIFKGVSVYKKIILLIILKTSINNKFLNIISLTDSTQIPYNGCRLKKIKKR